MLKHFVLVHNGFCGYAQGFWFPFHQWIPVGLFWLSSQNCAWMSLVPPPTFGHPHIWLGWVHALDLDHDGKQSSMGTVQWAQHSLRATEFLDEPATSFHFVGGRKVTWPVSLPASWVDHTFVSTLVAKVLKAISPMCFHLVCTAGMLAHSLHKIQGSWGQTTMSNWEQLWQLV